MHTQDALGHFVELHALIQLKEDTQFEIVIIFIATRTHYISLLVSFPS